MANKPHRVAIIDFDLGNLFSVTQACRAVGIDAFVTQDSREAGAADAIILPGVGGFPRAMSALHKRGLCPAIKDAAGSGKLVIGICLGMQLLMQSSTEFGYTEGLGLIEGDVDRLPELASGNGRMLPIPNVGWNSIAQAFVGAWEGTPLHQTKANTPFYFVHSYFVRPRQQADALAMSQFGTLRYCAAVRNRNVIGFQFHPERSGEDGLQLYRALPSLIDAQRRV